MNTAFLALRRLTRLGYALLALNVLGAGAYVHAKEASDTYLTWKRTPIHIRFESLLSYAKPHIKAHVKLKEVAPTKEDPFSYATFYFKQGKVPAVCDLRMVYDTTTQYSTWAANVDIDDRAAKEQAILLLDGFTLAHELGHCVHFSHNHTFPTQSLPKAQREDALNLYHETYADLYALALLAKRMDPSLFNTSLNLVHSLRRSNEEDHTHNTTHLLEDVDDLSYNNLRNMPLVNLPAVVHKAALAYTRMRYPQR